jgi:hypothetical protein
MEDRRSEPRMLCADLIDVWWTDQSGRRMKVVANLEDISNSGACLEVETRIASGTLLHFCHSQVQFEARVRYCVFRDTGYFIGVDFEGGFQWDERLFRPQHLLDPRTLVGLMPRQGPQPGPRKIQ